METKLLIVVDKMTEIPVIAMRVSLFNMPAGDVLHRAGYGNRQTQAGYTWLGMLDERSPLTSDPFKQPNATMRAAHMWLTDRWGEVRDGERINVQTLRESLA